MIHFLQLGVGPVCAGEKAKQASPSNRKMHQYSHGERLCRTSRESQKPHGVGDRGCSISAGTSNPVDGLDGISRRRRTS